MFAKTHQTANLKIRKFYLNNTDYILKRDGKEMREEETFYKIICKGCYLFYPLTR